jgi:hypothetical protein
VKQVVLSNSGILVEFDWNFSKADLYTANLTLKKEGMEPYGYSIMSYINGADVETGSKILYIDNKDVATDKICVKDSLITSISQISANCNGASETKFDNCTSLVTNGSISCYYNSTLEKYVISGLSHSGGKEMGMGSGQEEGIPETGTAKYIAILAILVVIGLIIVNLTISKKK